MLSNKLKVSNIFSFVRSATLDILFPIFCVECGVEGEWWCEKCLRRAKISPKNIKVAGHLDGLTAFFEYADKTPVSKLLQQFKYNYARDIEKLWKGILLNCYSYDHLPHGAAAEKSENLGLFSNEFSDKLGSTVAIMPVPLHLRRERERGYNQAEILAKVFLLKALSCGYAAYLECHKLSRVRYTEQQAKLTKEKREDNIREAFAWRGVEKAPETVVIVDDVYTTGATLQECARILKQHGSKHVYGLVLAKAI